MSLRRLPSVDQIEVRLKMIFPEGTPHRNYCTRLIAARTVFVMLYIEAIEGTQRWLAPKQVYRMSDEQAALQSDQDRLEYAVNAMKPGFQPAGHRWYADNTREPVRDETLKEGLAPLGAIAVRQGLATTSGLGRYALAADFAALFDPSLDGDGLDARLAQWQAAHLTRGALARIQIARRGVAAAQSKVLITFPNGETRQMEAGPSSIISKAVIEDFAPRFLDQPAVVWLSESGNKVVALDDALARSIGLRIEADKVLPDIILADLGPSEPLLVFVEVVASDGPISDSRKRALLTLATSAGFTPENVAFLTAYQDRNSAAFKRTVSSLAWQSFAWFVTEPDHILILRGNTDFTPMRLSALLG